MFSSGGQGVCFTSNAWSECRKEMVPPRQDLELWPEEAGGAQSRCLLQRLWDKDWKVEKGVKLEHSVLTF